ncbi:MAG: MMPL family transporter [Prevotellaceae bacterium]|nr:MMPL family transporter [Prevotellaceae bacterium]
MTELCIRIYRYFQAHRAVFWTTMIGLFVVFGFFASRIHLEEDLNKLMPASRNPDGSVKLAFADLRIKDKTFLLFQAKDKKAMDQLAPVCDAFVADLEKVDSKGGKAQQSIDNIFCSIPEDIMGDGIDYLSAHLPAYIDTTLYSSIDSLLTPAHFQKQMQQNAEDFSSEIGDMYPELISMDPIGMRNVLQKDYAPLISGGSGSYKIKDDHIFVKDGTVCLAFITPRFSATNTGQGSKLFEELNDQIKKYQKTHPDIKICYHGTPASGYYNSTTIKHDLTTTVFGSLIVAMLLIWFCFRNGNTLPLLFLPVAFGALFGLALMDIIRGEFSLLALGIGAVILGVSMSYVLHVLTHFKYVSDVEQVLREEVKPVCLGCITTVGSFLGLVFVKTDLLQDFGLFATFSIVGTTAFSLIFLPQFLNPKNNKINRKAFNWIEKINDYPYDRKRPLIITVSAIVVICLVAFLVNGGTQFDADMHDLGYNDPEVSYSENLLESKTYTGDKTKYFASTGKTMEEAIENFGSLSHQLDSLQRIGLVKSYTHTEKVFVPLKVQQQRIRAWYAFWTPQRLQKVRSLIAATAPQAGLTTDAFDTFFDSFQQKATADPLYKADIIPAGYLSTLMERSYGGDYLCYTSVRCKNDSIRSDHSDYSRICNAVASKPHQMVLDTYYYTTDNLKMLNSDFNVLQWISMAFVFVVLLLSFKGNIKLSLLGFMPIILSWIVVLGAMAIFGMKFNLVNIIISTFIFGIGVDYSIFVMSGLVDGGDGSKLLAYHKTAIFFSAAILVITLGSMLLATHPAIKSVGFSTLVGLLSAVILSYVLQPAIYRKWIKK